MSNEMVAEPSLSESVKDRILKDAHFNTHDAWKDGEPNVIEGYTDEYGQRWTPLNSYQDLLDIFDCLRPESQHTVKAEKQLLTLEIAAGVTFGFWMDKGQLRFDR
ncbi:hypothetical protein [Spirosoma endbachense]|uniref:Uncharacterized protein n=1 Tax=Spirosoma endbachense TaxID=2666025 RepID=A0A6P1W1S8_9BACT|nr:hypothetical protein [Spirosoma endbachense]QHV97977.1 hypothetical protein GJR95_24505 [Spirosoma endbachense]